MKNNRRNSGLTIIELMVAIGILAVLGTAIIMMGLIAQSAAVSATARTTAEKSNRYNLELIRDILKSTTWDTFQSSLGLSVDNPAICYLYISSLSVHPTSQDSYADCGKNYLLTSPYSIFSTAISLKWDSLTSPNLILATSYTVYTLRGVKSTLVETTYLSNLQ